MNLYTVIQNHDNWVLRCSLCSRKIRIEYKTQVPARTVLLRYWENHNTLALSKAFGTETARFHNA